MEAITSTFHVDIKLIIAQLINFVITLVLVYFVLGKPLIKMMHKRDLHIREGVNNAATAKELIEKTKSEYDLALSNAQNEANNIYQEGKKQAEIKKTEMIENAKVEVALMIENGKKSLESEKQKIMDDVKKEIVELTINATSKVLAEHGSSGLSSDTVGKIKSI
jgi:F-type H+-transporting ATPase subunit b